MAALEAALGSRIIPLMTTPDPAAPPPLRDAEPPAATPLHADLEAKALIPLSPPADAVDEVEEEAASTKCRFCDTVVTPADSRCPTCFAVVVPPYARLETLASNARTVYVLQAISFVCGITAIPGLIMSYSHRKDARGTWLDSHYDWQIDTFWGMFWFGLVASVVFGAGDRLIGDGVLGHGPALLVTIAGAAWYAHRVVKGWSRLSDGDPVTEY